LASGDIRAAWLTWQALFHSRQKVIYDNAECADLVNNFSHVFVNKVKCTLEALHSLTVVQQAGQPELRDTQDVNA
jgi:hypothetical protein